MFLFSRRWATLVVLAGTLTAALPRAATAQVSSVKACSQGALANCATIQLTSQLGVGPGGLNLFEIALQNLGSLATPNLATSIYNLVFITGQTQADPGTEVDQFVTPVAKNGATISDPTPWSLFESGDAIFLSALSGNGVGGCMAGNSAGGFGQMGQTCGPNDLITFSFFTSRAFDPVAITFADIEFVGLVHGNPSDSCSDIAACTITAQTPVTATPEPATLVMVATGFAGLARFRRRRRMTAAGQAITPES